MINVYIMTKKMCQQIYLLHNEIISMVIYEIRFWTDIILSRIYRNQNV